MDTEPRTPAIEDDDGEWVECFECGGEGGFDGEQLMELDPLWYGPDDWEQCGMCYGKGGWIEPWAERPV